MTQPLFVDTIRLERAAVALQGVAVPQPPGPITVAGTDAVSAAVNETMPVIESPVLDGLPVADVALAKTAANLAAAANRYADTDRSLGRSLAQQEIVTPRSVAPSRPAASSEAQMSTAEAQLRDAPVADPPPKPAVPADVIPEIPGNGAEMGQKVNQIMGQANSVTQSLFQSAQGAAQNQPLAEQFPGKVDRETDADAEHAGEDVDGAAPAGHNLEGVPTQVVAEPAELGSRGALP